MKDKNFKIKTLFVLGLSITIMMHVGLWIHYTSLVFSPILLIFSIIFEIVFITITAYLASQYEKLKEQIDRDPMTQIYNWKHMKLSIEAEIQKTKRTRDRFGVIQFDIDDFKRLNNEYGHYTGDQAILEIVDVVKSAIRIYDIFGRLGGEEFCVILPGAGRDEVEAISERIRHKIEKTKINRKIPITVSIGASLVRDDDTYYSIYQRADDAMYRAKERGKNRVVFD
jgi:diguanylate cyclase (GGDEF)-like protein